LLGNFAKPAASIARMVIHDGSVPPEWALKRPKSALRHAIDFVAAPLRMVLLPDRIAERLGLTSLRAERFAAVLPELVGRVLDVGAGDNALLRLYRESSAAQGKSDGAVESSVGIDVVDWGGGCVVVPSCERLPFEDASFDTVSFVACINHIPERRAALSEARRVLRPQGRVAITMINRRLGGIGHRIWWYSEDKHRAVALGEVDGMDRAEVLALLRSAGFNRIRDRGFVYGLNRLYVAEM
jgi:SAM-dependent methyltransferase